MLEHLQHGRRCFDLRKWNEAYQALSLADQAAALEAADLERLATCACLSGRDLEFQQVLERLHRGYLGTDDAERAARCAFWLTLEFLIRGEPGQANAWLARGQRLIQDHDCVERGYLQMAAAEQQLRAGKAEAAHERAAQAVAVGESFGDVDLTAAARHVQGRALIHQGEILLGLGRLDEAMLSVVAGELSPLITGMMYCSVIDACQKVYALDRAREWTAAFSRVCEQQPEMAAFTGICLVHRAEILQFHGAWPDAMEEARRACERSEQAARKPPASAHYQQAEIHRLRGELEQAEEAYRATSQLGREPQPGLALLRLAQGRTDAAGAAIRRLLGATADGLARARLLPAHLEIALALGHVEEARGACAELAALAETLEADVLRATAVQAHGAIALAEGDARSAVGILRQAFEVWESLAAPYESARVRVLIGQACRALGDEEAATLEFEAARAVFVRLGARPDLARLDALAAPAPTRREHPLTTRELDVLRLVAGGHTNKAIAARLCLSERTIDRHLSNILGKLHVPSRTAATAWAYDHKVL
jgi:DNA-binding CsgD family transcriptional regulator